MLNHTFILPIISSIIHNKHHLVLFQLNDSGPHKIEFEVTTDEVDLLPLRDLAVFNNGDDTHEFGFSVGQVCFY